MLTCSSTVTRPKFLISKFMWVSTVDGVGLKMISDLLKHFSELLFLPISFGGTKRVNVRWELPKTIWNPWVIIIPKLVWRSDKHMSCTVLYRCKGWRAVSTFLHNMSMRGWHWWFRCAWVSDASPDRALSLPWLHSPLLIREVTVRIQLSPNYISLHHQPGCIVLNIFLFLICIFMHAQSHTINNQASLWSFNIVRTVCLFLIVLQGPHWIDVGCEIVSLNSWTFDLRSMRWWTSIWYLFEKYMIHSSPVNPAILKSFGWSRSMLSQLCMFKDWENRKVLWVSTCFRKFCALAKSKIATEWVLTTFSIENLPKSK